MDDKKFEGIEKNLITLYSLSTMVIVVLIIQYQIPTLKIWGMMLSINTGRTETTSFDIFSRLVLIRILI